MIICIHPNNTPAWVPHIHPVEGVEAVGGPLENGTSLGQAISAGKVGVYLVSEGPGLQ